MKTATPAPRSCKLLVVPGADHAMSYYMGRGAYEGRDARLLGAF
ncbi:MAG: hypothetical protein ACLRSD_07730 [Oscillibacter sp.]